MRGRNCPFKSPYIPKYPRKIPTVRRGTSSLYRERVVPNRSKGRVIQAVRHRKKKKNFLCVALCRFFTAIHVARCRFFSKSFFFEVKKIICRQNKKKSVDRIKIFLVRNKNFLVDRFFFLDNDDELRKHYYLSISVAVIFF